MSEEKKIPYKIYLEESEMPTQWYNVRADMKNKPAPLLNPATKKPMSFDELRAVFCDELVRQELDDTTAYFDIPAEIQDFYKFAPKALDKFAKRCYTFLYWEKKAETGRSNRSPFGHRERRCELEALHRRPAKSPPSRRVPPASISGRNAVFGNEARGKAVFRALSG